ncbi:hypothetical protein BKA67DRAFT_551465 [Truncatella angustata]|uniref:Zn(2)-C6 fungal-type domain-containing protein n=1 Tax=Truncatella angustata TaxID=152316 RepID=A0A9P8ZZK7_9PEZI|nr:uncharacterized protein BKA67DRAFT_551465 [Truncatella angustata]KAH6656283.1 hypothetical protein BKA67DRAFT_551465 [Truncatella angustata]
MLCSTSIFVRLTMAPSQSIPTEATLPTTSSRIALGKARSSCNRCHLQKLKCVKNTSYGSCERCLRLGTSCRFTARTSRVHRNAPRCLADCGGRHAVSISPNMPMPSVQFHSVNTNVTGIDLLFSSSADPIIANDTAASSLLHRTSIQGGVENIQNRQWFEDPCESMYGSGLFYNDDVTTNLTVLRPVNKNSATISPQVDASSLFSRGEAWETLHLSATRPFSSAARLASLNVALYECTSKLPSKVHTRSPLSDWSVSDNCAHKPQRAKLFVIDELFRVTADFLNIIENFNDEGCDASTNVPPVNINGEQIFVPNLRSAQKICGRVQSSAAPTSMEPSSIFPVPMDIAILDVLISCHHQLTEAYVAVFQRMQACIRNHNVSPLRLVPENERNWGVILPELKMGSIVTTPAVCVTKDSPISTVAAASMYMSMIALLSSQLWDRVAAVMKQKREMPSVGPSLDLRDMLWDTMSARTDQLSNMIDATKSLL